MTNQPTTPHTVSGLGPTKAQTHTNALSLRPETYAHTLDCVQCGLCLPACPTYLVTGHEGNSPRGRIRLIKGLADGRAQATPALLNHLDLCLDCRACETACPSNVAYHELIEQTRIQLANPSPHMDQQEPVDNTITKRLMQAFTLHVLPYPRRLRWILAPAAILQRLHMWSWITRGPIRHLIPSHLLRMMQLLPHQAGHGDRQPSRMNLWARPLQHRYQANAPDGQRRAIAALFKGCVGGVLYPQLERQSVSLLCLAGCDVIVPKHQHCCGAIHHHNGRIEEARAMARRNIDAFLTSQDETASLPFIVNHIAGCGAMLKSYAELLRDDPVYATRATRFVDRVRDISEVLTQLKLPPLARNVPAAPRTVTYHDACHLLHAQKIEQQPRQLLKTIPNLELRPLADSNLCCGAAGSYNLMQPEMANTLGERKVRQIESTGAHTCATGNVGCAMHLQCQARRMGLDLKVTHPISLLHEAYFGHED